MGVATDTLREYVVYALDVVRRRWRLLVLPVLIAGLAGAAAVKLSPKKYTATSLLLIQGANRTAGGGPIQQLNAFEQVRALEAWLKSDQILTELLPQMSDYTPPSTAAELLIQTRALASSLSLQLASATVLEISLNGSRPEGLGRNLEIVIARLMEGLTGPEQNVLSAPQFMLLRRNEDVALAERALASAIKEGGFGAPLQIRTMLQQLWTMTHLAETSAGGGWERSSPGAVPDGDKEKTEAATAATRLRNAISSDPKLIDKLEQLYAAYQTAVDRQEALRKHGNPSYSNYVSIFDSPDNLLVIGRPKDPIFGESVAKKPAIAGIILSIIVAGALVAIAELLEGRLRTRKDYEVVAGLPVVARIGRLTA